MIIGNFSAAKGLSNPHLQTLLPRIMRRRPLFTPYWETLETPDGDFVELAWSENPSIDVQKPIFVLFHGLEGSFYSPYANGLMHAFAKVGWLAVMMHFRGCGPTPNRLARSYHSGEIDDARHFINMLEQRYPHSNKVAVGISLGGNMLVNYLAHYQSDTKLNAASVVSAPLDLAACSKRIEKGFSKIYRNYLLTSMKNNSLKKIRLLNSELGLSPEKIKNMRKLYQFDDLITAPLHGFRNAKDYYKQCSGLHRLSEIQIPTQIIHAQDDPFMTNEVIPKGPLPKHIQYCLQQHGGHVGFVTGSIKRPRFWLEQVLPEWHQRFKAC